MEEKQSQLTVFTSEKFGEIRTAGTSENPTFCLKDICRVLGLQPGHVMERIDKGVVSTEPLSTPGGVQQFKFVNEDGLWDTVLESRKPEAKQFRKWLTSEVIPSIRKHGAYMTPKTIDDIIADPRNMAKLLLDLADERDRAKKLEEENAAKDRHIGELNNTIVGMSEKVSYLDKILASKSLITTKSIAQDYGESAIKFNKRLHDLHVQYKTGGQWYLYADYLDKGYVSSKTILVEGKDGEEISVTHTKWTQKGRLFLYELLKDNGVLPLIERR